MHNFKVLIAILALLSSGWGSCSVIQHASKTGCGATNTTCTLNSGQGWSTTGAGHLVVAAIGTQTPGQTLSSVTGPGTFSHCDGTHTNCVGSESTGGEATDIDSTFNSTAASSITATRSASGGTWWFAAIEVACSGTLAADNSGNNSTSTLGTSQSGVGMTLTGTNDFIIQVEASSSATPNSITQGYTIQESAVQMGFASLNNTTNGTQPNWTLSGSSRSATSAIAINDGQPPAVGGHNSLIPMMGVGD